MDPTITPGIIYKQIVVSVFCIGGGVENWHIFVVNVSIMKMLVSIHRNETECIG